MSSNDVQTEPWLTRGPYSTQKNPDDVVITLAIRTPLTKGKKGGLKDTPLDGIVFKLLEQVVRKMRIDPQMVEDVCLGNVKKLYDYLVPVRILTPCTGFGC